MAKRSKGPVPKRVAGVKVPGVLRQFDWVKGALSSPLIREAIAAALVAGAGAAAGFTHAAADAVTGFAAEAAKKLSPDSAAADGKARLGGKPRGRKPKGENPQPTSADA